MRPEEIDKLFKDKLGNASTPPPAAMWERLQARMDAEALQTVVPVGRKKSNMSVYMAVAASLSLLLSISVVFHNIKTNPEVNQVLVANDNLITEEPSTPVAPETIAHSEAALEKKSDDQATEVHNPASTNTETSKISAGTKVRAKSTTAMKAEIAQVSKTPKRVIQNAAASNAFVADKAAEAADKDITAESNTVLASNAPNSNLNAQPIEITIKRSAGTQNMLATSDDIQSSENVKKTVLAKNIFKQVRNLANGDQVEFADLGIRAEKIALGAQIGKQKFSKVINL